MNEDQIVENDPVIGDASSDGWTTNYNMPGDDTGETNGLYAGVTSNNNSASDGGISYWADTGSDLIGGIRDTIKGVTDIAKEVGKGESSIRTAVAGARTQATQPAGGSITAQWNALSTLNKIAFICTIFGVVYVLRGGGA